MAEAKLPAEVAEDILPAPTREEAEQLVRVFREGGLSGHVTIILHFHRGQPMPSDLAMHKRQVGAGRRGPS